MKLLFVTECLGSGGAERQMVNLAIMLKEQGYDIHVLTWDPRDFYKIMLDENNVSHSLVRSAGNRYLRSFLLSYHVRKLHPDVVVSFLPGANIALCIGKAVGIVRSKLIISERNYTLHWRLKNKLILKLYKISDLLITNSEAERINYVANCSYPKEKIGTIRNFVDTEYFKPAPDIVDRNAILVISRIRDYKNPEGLMAAVRVLKERGYAFSITWVGHDYADDFSEHVKRLIKKLNIEDVFSFVAPDFNVLKFYHRAKAFCLPSFREGYPNVIIEAMSCGLPIICSNVCENPHIVTDSVNGFLFNPSNTDDIVLAFERLFKLTDAEYFNMGQRNRAKMLKNNSAAQFLDNYIYVLNKVLNNE